MPSFGVLKRGIDSFYKSIVTKEFTKESLEEPLEFLRNSLLENNVSVVVADSIERDVQNYLLTNKVRHKRFTNKMDIVKDALKQALSSILQKSNPGSFNLAHEIATKKQASNEPYIICVFGINGTGKTTTIMKLGYYLKQLKHSVVFGAGDTFRAGAIAQLTQHGNNIGINTISQGQGADPTSVIIDTIDHAEAKYIDVVIADTAGRMRNNPNLMRELEKVVRHVDPDLKIFVGDCNAGNDLVNQLLEFDKALGIDGIIITKFDEDENGGVILSASYVTGKPILFVADGQAKEDLRVYNSQTVLDLLV